MERFMKNLEDYKNKIGYVFDWCFVENKMKIEAISFYDYLITYWKEECTSPRGVESLFHIEPFKLCVDDGFEIRKWNPLGQSVLFDDNFGKGFPTQEDAELMIIKYWEENYHTKSWEVPQWFDTMDEIVDWLKETKQIPL